MPRLGWLSDIHLNFLSPTEVRAFLADVASHDVDAWLIGGDIGEADTVVPYLRLIEAMLPGVIYFTLGNHDFYGGSIATVTERVKRLTAGAGRLTWLTASEPQFTVGTGKECVAIVGDDGWADARYGRALTSPVDINDFHLIADLVHLPRPALVRALNALGDAAAARLAPRLAVAASGAREVFVLTHVPPFDRAAWHHGRTSDPDWVPWFACRAVGDAILTCAGKHRSVQFTVLCGHTHSPGTYSPAANVVVHTARAVYGAPGLQRIFESFHPVPGAGEGEE